MSPPLGRQALLALGREKGWVIRIEGSEVFFTRGKVTVAVMFGSAGVVINAREGLRFISDRDKSAAVGRLLRKRA